MCPKSHNLKAVVAEVEPQSSNFPAVYVALVVDTE